jgi:subtilisin
VKKFLLALVLVLVMMLPVSAYAGNDENKIIVFKEGMDQDAKQKAVKDAGGVLLKHLDLVNGAAVRLPSSLENQLRSSSLVEGIYPDVVVRVSGRFTAAPSKSTQEIPWGIQRIGAPEAWPRFTGNGVRVAVMDSGIDFHHPDLKRNIKGGFNAINHRQGFDDDFGHGTHVAGTIAALNNHFGVVGTGYKISLYGVKVIDSTGTGLLSDVIEGLNWSVKNHMQVVNMSIETSEDSPPLRMAIAKTYAAGVVIVASAGNSGTPDAPLNGPTSYPAAYPQVIAVSAVDQDGSFASWSNYGKIELCAPGVDVLSTIPVEMLPEYPYFLGSGTSMACPHVTGTVALIISTRPLFYDVNHNGVWDPAEIKRKLKDSAEPLAGLSPDQQGWGLVRADRAVRR